MILTAFACESSEFELCSSKLLGTSEQSEASVHWIFWMRNKQKALSLFVFIFVIKISLKCMNKEKIGNKCL